MSENNTADQSGADERVPTPLTNAIMRGRIFYANVGDLEREVIDHARNMEREVRVLREMLAASTQPAPRPLIDNEPQIRSELTRLLNLYANLNFACGATESDTPVWHETCAKSCKTHDEIEAFVLSVLQPFPAPAVQAIVPQVVQAPTNEQLREVLHKYSRCISRDYNSDTEFDSLQDVIAFARDALKLAAPIVATVPSDIEIRAEWIDHVSFDPEQAVWPEILAFVRGCFEVAAPSPTEQASDVQYDQMIGLLQTICQSENYGSRCANADLLGDMIRRLSAPADKGNAPDEVQS